MKRFTSKGPGLPVPSGFNQEHFIVLLHYRRDGKTTKLQNAYIEQELAQNEEARQLQEALQETFPGESFAPPVKRRSVVAAVAVAALIFAGSGFAILFAMQHRRSTTVMEHREATIIRFQRQSLGELCKIIERHYSVKVILDRPELSHYHYSGVLRTNEPLDVFLENLGGSSGIDYYLDSRGILHLK